MVLIALSISIYLFGTDCPETVSAWSYGPVYYIRASGKYAMIGSGSSLVVADVSDTKAPKTVSKYLLPSPLLDAVMYDNLAYAALGFDGVRVIDMRSFDSPKEKSSFYPQFGATGIDLYQDYAYVLTSRTNLNIYDVSNPYNPMKIKIFTLPDVPKQIRISNHYAFITFEWQGLKIYDLTAPENPVEIGSYSSGGNYKHIDYFGNRAFILDSVLGLIILDLTDPSNPTYLANDTDFRTSKYITAAKEYVYITDKNNILQVVKINSLPTIKKMGKYEPPAGTDNVYMGLYNKEIVLLACSHEGVRIIDVSNIYYPNNIGTYLKYGKPTDLITDGSAIFLAETGTQLRIMDYSVTPPQEISTLLLPDEPLSVTSYQSLLAAASSDSITLVDLSDLSNPFTLSTFPTGTTISDMVLRTPYLFVSGDPFVQILNVDDPLNPVEIASVTTGTMGGEIILNDPYLFIADYDRGVQAVNISDLQSPVLSGTPVGMHPIEIFVSRNRLYSLQKDCADCEEIISIYDISRPTNILELGTFQPGASNDFTVSGSRLYSVAEQVRVFDVSIPSLVTALGTGELPAISVRTLLYGESLLAANEFGGISLVDISACRTRNHDKPSSRPD